MQARYYDPVIGRFYSNDPVGFTGEVDTFNRYSYVGNNPYKYTDPDGREKSFIQDLLGSGSGPGSSLRRDGANMRQFAKTGGDMGKQVAATYAGVALMAVPGPEDLVAGAAIAKITNGAESAVQGVKLEKQLASQSQLTQLSEGGGTVLSQPAKQANRIAAQHGVDPSNVQKVSSDAHTAKDGSQVQTHAFRDASTNKVIEPKSIIDETN